MAEHTPGPWTIQAINLSVHRVGFEYIVRDARNCALAEVGHIDSITDGGEGEANARLIAAAPELLAALEAAFDSWYDDPRHFQTRELAWVGLARAAIAKAAPAS